MTLTTFTLLSVCTAIGMINLFLVLTRLKKRLLSDGHEAFDVDAESRTGAAEAIQSHSQLSYFHQRLELALEDTSGVIVPAGRDADRYFDSLRKSIRDARCEPFMVVATVEQPGFFTGLSSIPAGQKLIGHVVAAADGYWLVFDPMEERFYCFLGASPDNLIARSICGNPLLCWTA